MIDNLKGSFDYYLNSVKIVITNVIHYSYSSIFQFHFPLNQPNVLNVLFQQKPKPPKSQTL